MMHTQKRTALAVLRSNRSFAEAAESSGLTANEVTALWFLHCPPVKKRTKKPLPEL